MSDAEDRFLELEKEAYKLVDLLKELKKEIEGYQQASRTLDDASKHLSSLCSQCKKVIINLQDLISTLKTLDTLAIKASVHEAETGVIQEVQKVQQELNKITTNTQKHLTQLEEQTQNIRKKAMIMITILLIGFAITLAISVWIFFKLP